MRDTAINSDIDEEERTDQRRNRILDHSLRTFLANGYDGANIEDIAIAAGVSKVTIYRYFGDKAGLVAAVMRTAARAMVAACRPPLEAGGRVETVLTDFAIRYITWMTHNIGARPFYEISRLILEVSYRNPAATRDWHDTLLADMAAPLQAYIQTQIERGELGGDDAAFLTLQYFQSLMYTSAAIVAPDDGPAHAPADHQIADFAARKVRLFLHGCGGK